MPVITFFRLDTASTFTEGSPKNQWLLEHGAEYKVRFNASNKYSGFMVNIQRADAMELKSTVRNIVTEMVGKRQPLVPILRT